MLSLHHFRNNDFLMLGKSQLELNKIIIRKRPSKKFFISIEFIIIVSTYGDNF